jgi:hypothetical protein
VLAPPINLKSKKLPSAKLIDAVELAIDSDTTLPLCDPVIT